MITLSRAVQALQTRFGSSCAGAYVPGNTSFRDLLCTEFRLSQAEAEILCDSLEKGGGIRFVRSAEEGPLWRIDASAVSDDQR